MIHVSVVICTYNRSASLEKTIDALDHIDLSPDISVEIVIVDNNSSDNTKEIVDNFINRTKHNARYVFEENQGKSFALNRGISESTGDVIAFTDDDILVRKDWILNIINAFHDTGCSCVGGKINLRLGKAPPEWLSDKMIEHYGLLDLGNTAFLLKNPKLYGANIAVSRSVIEKHGNFNVALGPKGEKMHNNEDVCFVEKLISGGEKVLYSPDVVVEHIVPSEHIEKSYFRKRMYYHGEINGYGELKNRSRTLLGIPLYRIKEFITTACEYIYMKFTSPLESFQKEIRLAEQIGYFVGRIKYQRSISGFGK